jgi:hypothetical protein
VVTTLFGLVRVRRYEEVLQGRPVTYYEGSAVLLHRSYTENAEKLRHHGFETRSAPAFLAATSRGFTFCLAAPGSLAREWDSYRDCLDFFTDDHGLRGFDG